MAMRAGVDSINVVQHDEDQRISVLEVNDLDDFLIQAEMANREFSSEKEQMVILDETTQAVTMDVRDERPKSIAWSDNDYSNGNSKQETFAFQELSVPRRPAWDETTTPEQLDMMEKESFLEWRRQIAKNEETIAARNLGVTPFEKNIEIWRQLWRVMERCSCIVQIVDARNPLFYLSKDLKSYATKELGKPMLLLVNKSDFLTPAQRRAWHEFFSDPENPWDHVFFSAHIEQKKLDEQPLVLDDVEDVTQALSAAGLANDDGSLDSDVDDGDDDDDDDNIENSKESREDTSEEVPSTPTPTIAMSMNNNKLDDVGIDIPLSRQALLDWLHDYAVQHNCPTDKHHDRIPFGMVGFPNVGKSSVINVLMGNSKHSHNVVRVAVAAQPGKTKHFQTLLLPSRDDMLLCDCPGLVFPSFVNNTADLLAAGVYPISQMRDPWPVLNLLCQRIPRDVLNAQYGIKIPMPAPDAFLRYDGKEGTIPPPTAEEFLSTYCVARGMLAASSGVPDHTRASRIVIKDYAAGKLLYCHPPPTCDDKEGFYIETMKHALQNTKRLREKFAAVEEDRQRQAKDHDDDDDDIDIDEDDMLLELMGGGGGGGGGAGAALSAKKKTKAKKWGKKGRKFRNSDPYGCHSNPDEALLLDGSNAGGGGPAMGVHVKSGKKNKKHGYTRPVGYGGVRTLG